MFGRPPTIKLPGGIHFDIKAASKSLPSESGRKDLFRLWMSSLLGAFGALVVNLGSEEPRGGNSICHWRLSCLLKEFLPTFRPVIGKQFCGDTAQIEGDITLDPLPQHEVHFAVTGKVHLSSI